MIVECCWEIARVQSTWTQWTTKTTSSLSKFQDANLSKIQDVQDLNSQNFKPCLYQTSLHRWLNKCWIGNQKHQHKCSWKEVIRYGEINQVLASTRLFPIWKLLFFFNLNEMIAHSVKKYKQVLDTLAIIYGRRWLYPQIHVITGSARREIFQLHKQYFPARFKARRQIGTAGCPNGYYRKM